jgi:S1-C subfamily serine protease
MNRIAAFFTIVVAFVLVGCTTVQDRIDSKRNGVFFIINELADSGGGVGTGFLIGENEILTNAHVVANAKTLQIKMENSTTYEAELVLKDDVIDMALIRLKDWDKFAAENEYTVLRLADSSSIRIMDEVYAIGNPWGLTFSVSKGIVSHPIRRNDATPKFLIQTDAHVFQGNSGGPLLDSNGDVIGINSLMLSREGGSYGFALHSDIAKKVLNDWKNGHDAKWPQLGVSIRDDKVIMEVTKDSPADKAGVKKDDIILGLETHIGNFRPANSSEIIFDIALTAYPEPVKLILKRDESVITVVVEPNYRKSEETK